MEMGERVHPLAKPLRIPMRLLMGVRAGVPFSNAKGWLVPTFVVLVLLGVIGNTVWVDYRRSLDQAQLHSSHVAAILTENLSREIGKVSLTLEAISRYYALNRILPVAIPDSIIRQHLTEQALQLEHVSALAVYDAQRRPRLATGDAELLNRVAAMEPLFQELARASDAGARSARPIVAPDGSWQLTAALPLARSDGAFDGAIVAVLDLRFLDGVVDRSAFAHGSAPSVVLLDVGGVVVYERRSRALHHDDAPSAYGGAPDAIGTALHARLHDQIHQPAAGILRTDDGPNDDAWIGAYRKLPAGDVVVTVARAHADIVAALLLRRKGDLALVAVSVLGLLIFGVMIGRHARRRRGAEVARQQAEVRLSHAIEAMSEGFAVFDPSDRLVIWNGRYEEIFHAVRDVIAPGAHFRDIIEATLRRGTWGSNPLPLEERLRNVLSAHRRAEDVDEAPISGGRWVRVTKRRTEDGYTVAVYSDITQLKEREAAMRAARDEAQAADRAKSEFLAVMSHELRTPLNAIIGFSDLLRQKLFGPLGDARYEDYVQSINESGVHLLSLINDILDLSRIEAGKSSLAEEELSIHELIEAGGRLVKPRTDEKRITFRQDCPDDLPWLRGDERAIKQIVINLLSNAVKFTSEGGEVSIAARLTESGEVTLSVADNGIGIAPEHHEMVLEPFAQVEGAFSRTYEGTGLGLPMVHALSKLHGARLTLDSALGRGTTVTVTFPASRTVVPEIGGRAVAAG